MWLNFSDPNFSVKNLSNKEQLPEGLVSFIEEYLDENDFIIAQSSGSTGKPKKLKLSKNAMKNSAIATAKFFNLEKGTRALLALPTKYIGGKMMLVRAIENKWNIFCIESSSKPLENINHTFDFAAMIPMQVQNSLDKLNLIETLIIGGAPVSSDLYHQLIKQDTNCYQTYGMTETVSHIALKAIKPFETFYQCLPGITIEVGEQDALIINAPKIAKEKIYTKDVIVQIEEDIFEWLGRTDFVINSGGVKIHPELVERKISPFLKERFFISSIPDDYLGEKLIMIIEGNTEVKLDFQTRLDRYEIPKNRVYIPRFIETENGKINRLETKKIALK